MFRLTRQTLSLFGILTFLLASTFSGGQAHAATLQPSPQTTRSSFVDFTALQKTCQGMLVHLNGAEHTISCLTSSTKAARGGSPHLNRDWSCTTLNSVFTIWNYNYSQFLCFEGSGYLGVAIYQVNEVDNTIGSPMWFRWYQNGVGNFRVVAVNRKVTFGSGTTNVEITQLCVGSTQGGHC